MFFEARAFNQRIDPWDISKQTMKDILIESGVKLQLYDKIIANWSQRSLLKSIQFGISSQYCEVALRGCDNW